jgi:hypothetical protein
VGKFTGSPASSGGSSRHPWWCSMPRDARKFVRSTRVGRSRGALVPAGRRRDRGIRSPGAQGRPPNEGAKERPKVHVIDKQTPSRRATAKSDDRSSRRPDSHTEC